MGHRTRIEARPSLGWIYHWPRCECGWEGDIVRTSALAELQITEDHPQAATAAGDEFEQPTLFD
ncbi:hypothetical protein ACFWZ7_24780 [Nocardiopsis alba]|uniref:hypothetical protein n=1 Tax=Nocardiopsis alba TaxID=53437 RepID=UPI00366A8EBF